MRSRKREKARLLGLMEKLELGETGIQDEYELERLRESVREGLWGIYAAEEREQGKKK